VTAYDPTRASESDHALAAELATDAGKLLLALRDKLGFGDADALRNSGDKTSHEHLMDLLAAARPLDGVLSEEGDDSSARLSDSRVWIVDPLDGTREFGEEGREDWAVHVALWVDGALAAGAVAMPAKDITYTAYPAYGVAGAAPARPRAVVSRTRPGKIAGAWADEVGAELIPMGSAGAKAMAVVSGEADVYLHSGGQYEWDSAAPVAVALAAGLHATRLDGSPMVYNNADPSLPDLVICRPELAAGILEFVRPLL
jgi:3'(2'), 5'-bisphosphate nucleotidase